MVEPNICAWLNAWKARAVVGQTEDLVRYRHGSPCETMQPCPTPQLSICSSRLYLLDQLQACALVNLVQGLDPDLSDDGPDVNTVPPSLSIPSARKATNEIKPDYILSTGCRAEIVGT